MPHILRESNLMQMYGNFKGFFLVTVRCLGFFRGYVKLREGNIMTPVETNSELNPPQPPKK